MNVAGLPLIAYSVIQATQSDEINEVIVSTDDEKIALIAKKYGAEIAWRPDELSNDIATSESAVVHALDWRLAQNRSDPDFVVFLQATSPVRAKQDIDLAVRTFKNQNADSLLSVCDTKRFLWTANKSGNAACSLNYDYKSRKREQDMHKQFQENGSIYITKTDLLRKWNNRLGGNIALYEMHYWTNFQIDEPEDIELIEWIISTQKISMGIGHRQ